MKTFESLADLINFCITFCGDRKVPIYLMWEHETPSQYRALVTCAEGGGARSYCVFYDKKSSNMDMSDLWGEGEQRILRAVKLLWHLGKEQKRAAAHDDSYAMLLDTAADVAEESLCKFIDEAVSGDSSYGHYRLRGRGRKTT